MPSIYPVHCYNYQASAYGVAGQIDRPVSQTIPIQASSTLPPTGGHGTHSVPAYQLGRIVSFSAAHTEVGGSCDDLNKMHATYACSVIENLNIMDVVLADRVTSRLTIYYPSDVDDESVEPSFSIAGSQFDNLRIAGHQINLNLADNIFNDSTYSTFATHSERDRWLIGEGLNNPVGLDHNQAIVDDIARRYNAWRHRNQQYPNMAYWGSAASRLALPQGTGLQNFGGIVCVPRFGVVYLCTMRIERNTRQFNMIQVCMCSPGSGFVGTGGTGGSGGGTMPPRP